MVRKILAWFFAFMLAAAPCLADSQGSATGGTAGTQSTGAGCIQQSPTLSANQQATVSCDSSGNLKVTGTFTPSGTTTVVQPTAANLNATVIGTGTFVTQNTITPSATIGVSTQSCTVACASTIISGAHSVYGISASATVTGTILVYDATSCTANGTVTPKKAFAYTVANGPIGISWADVPMINATGIAVCFSSTGPFTATASTTAFLSVDYK